MERAVVHSASQKTFLDWLPLSLSTSTSSSSPTPGTAQEEESGKETTSRSESWLQAIALLVAISSFLYLMLTLGGAVASWLSKPGTLLLTQRNNDFAANLTYLGGMSSTNGSSFRGPTPRTFRGMDGDKSKRIPKLIHQTFKTAEIPQELEPYVNSWKEQNPSWQYLFYGDTDCLEFVKKEYPQYLQAYKSLPKKVERADFFRYLIMLRYGGVYADLDAECIVPMDDVLHPDDTLVVGWECDMPSIEAAAKRHFVRRRQILQWVFAAAPGHPALREICDFIARNALTRFSDVSSNHNTLEKTGPGAWTDTILRHTANSETEHRIRILPQIAFGVHPSGTDGLHPESPGILVQHHFLGSWKSSSWGDHNLFQLLFNAQSLRRSIVKPSPVAVFPVSVGFRPSFTVMVHPSEAGMYVGASDVSLELTLRGSWQAGSPSPKDPRVVDVVAGSLGSANMDLHLLDIGAGLGFFSLAAASRRHPVIAFEPPGSNLDALRLSVQYNNFTNRVTVHSSLLTFNDSLSHRCITPTPGLWKDSRTRKLKSSTGTSDNASPRKCPLDIGVIRVGDTGWRIWKEVNGSNYVRRFEPEIIVAEYSPWRLRQAGWDNPLEFLQGTVDLGYEEMYHAGEVCDKRWQVLSKYVPEFSYARKSTWCKVTPDDFAIFERIAENERASPENILFVKRKSEEVDS